MPSALLVRLRKTWLTYARTPSGCSRRSTSSALIPSAGTPSLAVYVVLARFSLPGGAHRAVYTVLEEEHVCLVFLIGPHEGIYRKAERRFAALRR